MTRSLQSLMENSLFQKSHRDAIRSQGQHLENTRRVVFFLFFFSSKPLASFSNFIWVSVSLLPSLPTGSLIFTEEVEKTEKIFSSLFAFWMYIQTSGLQTPNQRNSCIPKGLNKTTDCGDLPLPPFLLFI